MEIAIDVTLVRGVLTQEERQAREDIRAAGVLRALERSQARHDARLAAAPDADTLDCRAGCSWCCHFSVDVRAAEVFAILDFVERSFTPAEQARLLADVRANRGVLEGLDEIGRMTRNVRCAFLVEGRCSIYPVRPQTCRNYHATNVAGCRQSYENPHDLDIDPEFAPGVFQTGAAHVDGFSAALREARYDIAAYELNAALDTALSDPSARERFDACRPPFPQLPGEDVPPQFDEPDDE